MLTQQRWVYIFANINNLIGKNYILLHARTLTPQDGVPTDQRYQDKDSGRKYWNYETITCPPIHCIFGDAETAGVKDIWKLTKTQALRCKGISAKQIVDCLAENDDWIPRKDNKLIGKIYAK